MTHDTASAPRANDGAMRPARGLSWHHLIRTARWHRWMNPTVPRQIVARRQHTTCTAVLSAALPLASLMASAAPAQADATAYLVNTTMRPGYNFANAEQALDYGQSICARIEGGRTYANIVGEIKADFGTTDEFQAAYLITQAANELCPDQIWQLRNSAAGYTPPPQ